MGRRHDLHRAELLVYDALPAAGEGSSTLHGVLARLQGQLSIDWIKGAMIRLVSHGLVREHRTARNQPCTYERVSGKDHWMRPKGQGASS